MVCLSLFLGVERISSPEVCGPIPSSNASLTGCAPYDPRKYGHSTGLHGLKNHSQLALHEFRSLPLRAVTATSSANVRCCMSDRHDLGFFLLHQAINPGCKVVGKFLDLVFGVLDVVLGNTLYFLELLVSLLADIPDADPAVFALVADLLDKLFPTLFCEHGNVDDNLLAIVLWIEAEVGGEDGLLDFRNNSFLPGSDED